MFVGIHTGVIYLDCLSFLLFMYKEVDYEVELAVVVGKQGKKIPVSPHTGLFLYSICDVHNDNSECVHTCVWSLPCLLSDT